jgi:hypothetical protein
MSLDDSVKEAVQAVLPKGARFRLTFEPMRFSGTKIVRVITPAWKTLNRAERVLRLQRSLNDHLSPTQQKHIFRVSVLTPEEFKELRPFLILPRKTKHKNGVR